MDKAISEKRQYRFRPYERLRRRSEFELVRKEGSRFKGKTFILNYMESGNSFHRLGIIVPGKYYRKAVQRNRIKRCVREWFRTHKHDLKTPGKDLVVVALPGRQDFSCKSVMKELSDLCRRAGLMNWEG
ncbi:ribonuclease P protein component [Thermodesulforhabdus norvegica]|uniref:Ribonuclease P protein component n=1 Tax=Thermodesulforhabdus norvegica TaxID=39841 RepID=A0A1I4TE45_9BACT|nr:ribonuclease P protein component [Thermodesulforhabdus norvegica]SFM74840.1 ribonuclease P protein component [Thermodesulforhabdus norvegica]